MTARRPRTRSEDLDLTDDPVLAFLAEAPVDDEPATDDDLQALAEAWQTYRQSEEEAAPPNARTNGSSAG